MASLVSSNAGSFNASAPALTLTGVSAGNCLIAIILLEQSAPAISGVADNQGNTGWAQIAEVTGTVDGDSRRVAIWACFDVAAGDTEITVTLAGGVYGQLVVVEASGVDEAADTSSASGSSSVPDAGDVTPTTDGDNLILAACEVPWGDDAGPTGSYTGIRDANYWGHAGVMYLANAAASAQDTSFDSSVPTWIAVAAVFQPAGGGGAASLLPYRNHMLHMLVR